MKSKPIEGTTQQIFDACLITLEKLFYIVKLSDLKSGTIAATKADEFVNNTNALEIKITSINNEEMQVSATSLSDDVTIRDVGSNSSIEEIFLAILCTVLN